jgi:hypothetical protein
VQYETERVFGRAIAGVLDTAGIKLSACSMKLGVCLVEQLLGTASVKLRAFQYETGCVFGRAIAGYWILLV